MPARTPHSARARPGKNPAGRRGGSLPTQKSLLAVEPGDVQVSAFRNKGRGKLELRVGEVAGRAVKAQVELALPVAAAFETDLIGRKIEEVSRSGRGLAFPMQPWKLRTFEVES